MTNPIISTEVTPSAANRALLIVSCAVLLASSTWFSGTAATPRIVLDWGLDATGAAVLTSSVQIGFIVGTFLFALLSLADRYNPRRVFFASALAGALLNLGFAFGPESLPLAAMLRFLIGVTLAGIYPGALSADRRPLSAPYSAVRCNHAVQGLPPSGLSRQCDRLHRTVPVS